MRALRSARLVPGAASMFPGCLRSWKCNPGAPALLTAIAQPAPRRKLPSCSYRSGRPSAASGRLPRPSSVAVAVAASRAPSASHAIASRPLTRRPLPRDRRLRGRSARRSQGWPANSPGHLVDACLMTRLAASPRFTCSRRTSRTRIGRVTLQVAAPGPGSRTPLIRRRDRALQEAA
jgi:hypothetical protein